MIEEGLGRKIMSSDRVKRMLAVNGRSRFGRSYLGLAVLVAFVGLQVETSAGNLEYSRLLKRDIDLFRI